MKAFINYQLMNFPQPPLAIFFKKNTFHCRLIPEAFLGLSLGDAEIIRNAGGRVNQDVIRSMIVCQDVLGCDTVLVIHHTDCGGQAALFHPATLLEHGKHLAKEKLGIRPGGMNMQPIVQLDQSVRDDVAALRADPKIKSTTHLYGLVFDTDTGRLREVCQG